MCYQHSRRMPCEHGQTPLRTQLFATTRPPVGQKRCGGLVGQIDATAHGVADHATMVAVDRDGLFATCRVLVLLA